MCRNIRTLFNFDPPVTPEEARAASLQFVRKISGFHKPPKANEESFNAAIEEIAAASSRLFRSLDFGQIEHEGQIMQGEEAEAERNPRVGRRCLRVTNGHRPERKVRHEYSSIG